MVLVLSLLFLSAIFGRKIRKKNASSIESIPFRSEKVLILTSDLEYSNTNIHPH